MCGALPVKRCSTGVSQPLRMTTRTGIDQHELTATPQPVVDRILQLRRHLTEQGLDASPHTIAWHLQQERVTVPTATISRTLTRHAAVTAQPSKRPKSS